MKPKGAGPTVGEVGEAIQRVVGVDVGGTIGRGVAGAIRGSVVRIGICEWVVGQEARIRETFRLSGPAGAWVIARGRRQRISCTTLSLR